MITWDVLLIALGMTLLVALFMGPGMWSSDTEFLFVRLWRALWAKRDAPSSPPTPSVDAGDGDRTHAHPPDRPDLR